MKTAIAPRKYQCRAGSCNRPTKARARLRRHFVRVAAPMSLDIKICGLKTEAALDAALDGGASHVGFIFFAKSPRWLEPAEAGRLRQRALGRAKAVAVTVDAGDDMLDGIVAAMQP